jgi:hypothetical protein
VGGLELLSVKFASSRSKFFNPVSAFYQMVTDVIHMKFASTSSITMYLLFLLIALCWQTSHPKIGLLANFTWTVIPVHGKI